jgi:hypothetical protein
MAAAEYSFIRCGGHLGRRPSRLARPKRPGKRLKGDGEGESAAAIALFNLIRMH